ncbi:MAG: hypothetical protein QOI60_330 [Actinomycetota bacterium]|nr:hypothetical protein [Actinomycetota bacterium]
MVCFQTFQWAPPANTTAMSDPSAIAIRFRAFISPLLFRWYPEA